MVSLTALGSQGDRAAPSPHLVWDLLSPKGVPCNQPSCSATSMRHSQEPNRKGRQPTHGHTAEQGWGERLCFLAHQGPLLGHSHPLSGTRMGGYRVSSWKRSLQGPCSSRWAQLVTSCRGTSGMRSGPWGQAKDRSRSVLGGLWVKGEPP